MKPSDHPEFYRIAPPLGTSRESTIVLDREGRFSHDGQRIENVSIERALRGWIACHPENGRPILTNGYDWCYFRVDDAAYMVEALRFLPDGGVMLRLFDGTEEALEPQSLCEGEGGVVYAKVKGGCFEARFSRHAQTQLAELLVEGDPPGVCIAGHVVVLPQRAR